MCTSFLVVGCSDSSQPIFHIIIYVTFLLSHFHIFSTDYQFLLCGVMIFGRLLWWGDKFCVKIINVMVIIIIVRQDEKILCAVLCKRFDKTTNIQNIIESKN